MVLKLIFFGFFSIPWPLEIQNPPTEEKSSDTSVIQLNSSDASTLPKKGPQVSLKYIPSKAAAKAFIPGRGHFYLKQKKRAWGVIGLEVLAAGASINFIYRGIEDSNSDYFELAALSVLTFQDIFLYSIYDAHHNARILGNNLGYKSNLPSEKVSDHLLAPFDLRFLGRWTTLVPLATAAGLAYYLFKDEPSLELRYKYTTPFIISMNAAVSEEAFFRGFLYPEIENRLNTPSGILISSIAFGALHYQVGSTYRETLLTYGFATTFGAYMCYVVNKNNRSLKESIFIHFWWNFIVFNIQIFQVKKIQFRNSWNF